jgi:Cu/Ag efflux protein CusF
MNMKNNLLFVALLAAMLLASFTVSADENAGEPAIIVEDAAVAVAIVVAIDEASRKITLKDLEGDESTFTAGPEVRNFDQVKRGDQVIVSYHEGFALAFGPKGSGVRERIDSIDVARAELGEKPAVQITGSIAAIGTVMAIDVENRKVTLKGAKNTVVLEASEEVDLSQVKVGDEVEALYIKSYAVNVIPAPTVSGTVKIESTSVAVGIGVEWGHGTLTMYDGTTHKFDVNGLSVLDLGISKISATGEVFNLVEAKDLGGVFIAGEAGAALGGGGSVQAMKNGNGVVMQLRSTQTGVKLTLAPEGLQISLDE